MVPSRTWSAPQLSCALSALGAGLPTPPRAGPKVSFTPAPVSGRPRARRGSPDPAAGGTEGLLYACARLGETWPQRSAACAMQGIGAQEIAADTTPVSGKLRAGVLVRLGSDSAASNQPLIIHSGAVTLERSVYRQNGSSRSLLPRIWYHRLIRTRFTPWCLRRRVSSPRSDGPGTGGPELRRFVDVDRARPRSRSGGVAVPTA